MPAPVFGPLAAAAKRTPFSSTTAKPLVRWTTTASSPVGQREVTGPEARVPEFVEEVITESVVVVELLLAELLLAEVVF